MDVINLPSRLADEPDLATINRRLLTGEATLDWSQVKEASLEQLRVLLADLDLVEHSDILGIDSVPGDLAEIVLQAISYNVGETEQEIEQDTDPDVTDTAGGRPPGSPILQPPSPSAIRDELERLVLLDLLGPAGGPEEELEDGSVRDRYLVGALAPREQQTTPEEMDELAIPDDGAGEDSASDEGALQIASLCPSSVGFSFCVDDAATSLSVTAAWGYYRREHSATIKTPKGAPKMVWKRQQMGEKTQLFPLKEGLIPPWSPEPLEQPDVVVRGLMRRSESSWTVTLFLVNEQHEPERNRDQAWVFQPELVVEAPGGAPVFQRRAAIKRNSQNDEELTMAMLYRRHVGFAIGHGISVHAETLPGDSTRAVRLSACVVPTYDVPRTESPTPIEIPGLAGLVLDMKELAEAPIGEIDRTLTPLITAYEAWIAQQTARIDDPANDLAKYRSVALQAIQECRRTLERIREGIALLAQSGRAAKAFVFMNEAMWQQRIHTLHAEQKRRGQNISLEEIDKPENRSWRPFQLAFILLNLPALTDLHHPERSA